MNSISSDNAADPYFQTDCSASEFARRRSSVVEAIGDGVAVLQGYPATGAFDLFRQHNDFFYLTGVETPHAYLRIEGRTGRSILYLLPSDPELAEKEGIELNADAPDVALRLTGADEIKPLIELGPDLQSGTQNIFVCDSPVEGRMSCQDTLRQAKQQAERDPWRHQQKAFRDIVAGICPNAEIRDLSPILIRMRLIKSPAEIAVMRRAGKLTALGICEAMRSTAPGIIEGQLAAVAEYIFLLNGASGGGYRPIIAGGENIWNMHYYRNNCRLVAGDLVIMDYAPDCRCYTSDIGRMWPVSGCYEVWQRELYGFVVDYHLTLLDEIKPDRTPAEIRVKVAAKLMPRVDRTRWSCPSFKVAVETLLNSGQPFTHTVGMAVHDVGRYQDAPLRPGIVFALDPQLWVRDQRLYIRVEDTVVVTEDGVENLTQSAPHELGDVEMLMTEPGLIQSHPDLFLH